MSLKEKTVSGLLWSFTEQAGGKFLSFGINIFLARILVPEEFGLIAMLSVFVAIGTSLLDCGLNSSLIRSSEADEKDYSTVFFFNLVGSVIIYFLMFLLAPYIASFYKQEVLVNIIRVYGISFVINAFFSIQSTRLSKEMDFKTQTAINIPAVLGGGIVGILLAKGGYGVWSLVWMSLVNSLLSTIMHWKYSNWKPQLIFDMTSFRNHFFFGYKMTISSLIDTLYRNIYVLIIGKYYSAAQLGFYSRAEAISQLPISNVAAAINKVTYPMFATISGDDEKLKAVYRKLLKQVIFWNAPVLILLAVIAEPLFTFLITEKWLPAVPYFQILCIAGIMYPLHSYNLNILKVKGRSDLFLKLEVAKKVVSLIGIASVLPLGIYGLLYFQLGFSFAAYFINSFYSGKMINYPVREQIADILPMLLLAVLIGGTCYVVDQYFFHLLQLIDLGRISLLGLLYFLIYLSCSYLIKLSAFTDFKHLILRK